jgi:hypothetical protein
MSKLFEQNRRGVRFVLFRCTVGGNYPAWGVSIYWPHQQETGRHFMAVDVPSSTAKQYAKQWAFDRIDDYLNAIEG